MLNIDINHTFVGNNQETRVPLARSFSNNLNQKVDSHSKIVHVLPPSYIERESVLHRLEAEDFVPDSLFVPAISGRRGSVNEKAQVIRPEINPQINIRNTYANPMSKFATQANLSPRNRSIFSGVTYN